MPGRLLLCATPIGNLGDVSRRLAETLAEADVVYAEDTRHSGKLLQAIDVTAELRSFFLGNERRRSQQLADDLEAGLTVALITDAGTPAVSDPGRTAVAAARSVGAIVSVVPGPSAVTAAVAASGMVESRFVFEGFLARKGRERAGQLKAVGSETRPLVLFISPHRIATDLIDLVGACGEERRVFVGRELTKLHEELWWGTLGEAATRWQAETPRGEFTLVVEGAAPAEPDLDEAVDLAGRLVAEGESPSQAARRAAAATGAERRLIYQQLVEDRGET